MALSPGRTTMANHFTIGSLVGTPRANTMISSNFQKKAQKFLTTLLKPPELLSLVGAPMISPAAGAAITPFLEYLFLCFHHTPLKKCRKVQQHSRLYLTELKAPLDKPGKQRVRKMCMFLVVPALHNN